MSSQSASIIWYRRDFRLDDHPALRHAIDQGDPVIPVFIHAPEEEHPWEPGEASNWWLHNSLKALDESLKKIGGQLIIRRGESLKELKKIIKETGATRLYYNRLYEPFFIKRDTEIKKQLKADGIEVKSFNGALLNEPHEIEKKSGGPFKVFTPFWRQVRNTTTPDAPLAKPQKMPTPKSWPSSFSVDSLKLFPKLDWWKTLDEAWDVGEDAARKRLNHFLNDLVSDYDDKRNRPDHDGTSRISPYLHFGEISPRTIWHETTKRFGDGDNLPEDVITFLAEIGWREFAHHLLFHFPEMIEKPLNEKFENFPWEKNNSGLEAWQKGDTGFPIIDAGMRQLYETGWMHNRVRMIVGSFLVKDLRVHWLDGARWFWDTLVDASLASNTMGWQWVAGCGADAAPYFRVFNPITQGEKFDPKGEYTLQYCPELKSVPKKFLQQPWEMPKTDRAIIKLKLGEDYPKPIVDHSEERLNALAAYEKVKGK